ncbi:MAG: RNA methyltransferase [Pseudomonadota bacterium]
MQQLARKDARGLDGADPNAPSVILVGPQLGENIGATARAMLNFGLTDLRIVSPRDGWPNDAAVAMASGATAILDTALVVDSFDQAIGDTSYVLATTARPREMRLPVYSPEEAAQEVHLQRQRDATCALVFGAERRGLENEDILKCDGIVVVPTNPSFPSINLAQSVLLLAYEWRKRSLLGEEAPASIEQRFQSAGRPTPAPKSDFENLMAHLFDELDERDYFFPSEKRHAKERNLRTALSRAGLSEGEVRMFRGAIKSLTRNKR